MYKQIDGISTSSTVGPIISNIFVGFYEYTLIFKQSPLYYKSYVDNTVAVSTDETKKNPLLFILNNLHNNHDFTIENAVGNKLPFVDVLVHWDKQIFFTSVFKKNYFTGDYIPYNSYSPMQEKNLRYIYIYIIHY